MKRSSDVFAVVGLMTVMVVAKLSILTIPAYWDETRWIGPAFQMADWPLVRALPGFRPPDAFAGHPPGIDLIFAIVAKVTGASMVTGHLVSVGFAAAGLCFTYLLGARRFDRGTALLAAVLLLLSPAYFAQAGMFLADIPVAALAMASVYFVLSRRNAAYLVCATAMVLIKETSAAIVLGILLNDLFFGKATTKTRKSILALHALPLLPLGLFVMWQKIVTGYWWLIYSEPFDNSLLKSTLAMMWHQVVEITRWIFVAEGRAILTAVIALSLLMRVEARRRDDLRLFALVGLCAAYPFAFAGELFLPRYMMPVLPLVYLAGAWSLMQLARVRVWRVVAAVAIVIVAGVVFARQPFFGTAELNMRYLDVVRVHKEMADAIARDFSGARVLSAWPQSVELAEPRFGYVPATILAIEGKPPVDLDRAFAAADLVWVTLMPEAPGMKDLRDRAIAARWQLIRRVVHEPIVSELYARPRLPPGTSPATF